MIFPSVSSLSLPDAVTACMQGFISLGLWFSYPEEKELPPYEEDDEAAPAFPAGAPIIKHGKLKPWKTSTGPNGEERKSAILTLVVADQGPGKRGEGVALDISGRVYT